MIFSLIFIISLNYAKGQYFSTGNEPASIRWLQIDKPSYRFLFPSEHSKSAMEMAALIDQKMINIGASMKHIPRKFPLILHSYSTISNGWTIWAPRRVELFPRPPLSGGAEKYTDHLLIHEIRHMIQMDKLNQGVTKAASYILGDQAVAAVVGLHMPSWLSEGDAVLTETLLSESGRGRTAHFQQAIRAQWIDGKGSNYDQAIYGSYKNYLPNHYVLGYYMVAMGRMLGGPYLWSEVIDHIGRKPLLVSNMSRFLKKELSIKKEDLYEKTLSWFTNYWLNQPQIELNQPVELILNQSKEYTHYYNYQKESDSTGICLQKSMWNIPSFVRLGDNGKETFLIHPGYIDGNSFSYADGRIIWAENISDRRWENQSFSDLFVYSVNTKRKSRLTRKQRLFDPAFDKKGNDIVCIQYLPGQGNQLVILDSYSGKIKEFITATEEEDYMQPSWDDEGNIWVLSTGREGKKLHRIHPEGEKAEIFYDFGFREIYHPVRVGDEVYIVAPQGAANAVYSVDVNTRQLNLISTDRFGINHLNVSQQELYAAVYRNNGYKPVRIHLDSVKRPVKEIPRLNEAVTPLLVRAKGEDIIQSSVKQDTQLTKPYRKFFHLLKFHSWAPISINTNTYQAKPGIMLMTQNDLSSLSASAGIEYSYNQKRFEYYFSGDFTGWYPKLNVSARTYSGNDDIVVGPADTVKGSNYNYSQISGNISVPLNFSSGRWIRGIIPIISLNYSLYHGDKPDGNTYYRDYYYIGFGLKPYIYSRMSTRDLYPKIGFVSSFSTIGIATDETASGRTYLSGSVQSYLPGIMKNHSTRFYIGGFLANEWPMAGQSPLNLPRGLYRNFTKYNISTQLDYSLPIAYPDWRLGSWLYVKRLKTNLFIDAAKSLNLEHDLFLSYGLDLSSDFHFIRIGAEIDAGVRMIFDHVERKMNFELLFDFSIN
jgi:hypothetical protein